MTSTTLLLISGAGLPAWIWDDATTGLDAPVARRPEGSNASLLQYAQAALDSASPGAISIVAHSAGGLVAAAMTALAPARVRGILAVTAVIPEPRGSFIGAMPLPNRLMLSAVMRVAGTRPPASALRAGIASGLDANLSKRLVNDFTPESQAYYRDRTPMFDMPHHRGYVTTTNDREISPALQEGFATRLAPDFKKRIDGGHLPMLEHPEELRKYIVEFHASVQ
ncbi:alpha/beta fold hydrolase [Cryobacterium sp. TMT2-15-1]|uniref:alpha/beta fold hydrolase n=1 Tax=Cryobacterium sp. TMT2-15-1 TaxID=1259246 RepID=UPI00141AE29A|nr:alpha/beta hydrolase [Cryobacterium sp. TMT2-15-1]